MEKILKEIKSFCKKFEFPFSKVQIDSDSLVIYNGDIDFSDSPSFTRLPKALRHFKEIKGNLSFYCCYEIDDFVGLENLKKIGGFFCISETNFETFKGLENLEYIEGDFLAKKSYYICSFDDLKSLKSIGGEFRYFSNAFVNIDSIISFFERVEMGSYDCNIPYINSKHFKETKTLKKLIDGSFGISLNANDFFNYASADTILLDPLDLKWVLPIVEKYKYNGLDACMSYIAGIKPLEPYITPSFQEALKELETLKPKKYSEY